MRLPILGKKLWEVMSGYVGTAMSRVRKSGDIRTCETIRFSTVIIPRVEHVKASALVQGLQQQRTEALIVI